MYSTLLFDLDHTIFDFDASELAAFAAALAVAGIDDGDRHLPAYRTLNTALWDAAERGEIRSSEIRNVRFERLLAELGAEVAADVVLAVADHFVAGLGAHGDLYPGALELLDALDGRVQLGLISNGLGEVVHARLERLGIADRFDAVVVSSEVGVSKPHPGIFDAAFDRLGGPDKSSVLMIGDSLTSDIAGGQAYGIATAWYNPHGREAVSGAGFTHELTSLADVLALLDPPHDGSSY
jgi:YjjG family noncanonical pyrimidine nucleotidase